MIASILSVNKWGLLLGLISMGYFVAIAGMFLKGAFLLFRASSGRLEAMKLLLTRFLWLIFLYSFFPYAFVADVLGPQPLPVSLPLPAAVPLFSALALISAFLIFRGPVVQSLKTYWAYCLIRWSFAISIALYGLILVFLGAPIALFAIFWIAGFTLMIRLAPTRRYREQFELMRTRSPVVSAAGRS